VTPSAAIPSPAASSPVKDSSWLLSWTLNRQQQFRDQPKTSLCVWVYGLFSDKPGDYVKKPMRDCTGRVDLHGVAVPHRRAPEEDIRRAGVTHTAT